MSAIDVSVVMGVYNGADSLAATLQSVLSQQECALEFIVVDDGSTDATADILSAWAVRDPRLHVIAQDHTGLTRALERGCSQAQGQFIARQDCGDISLSGRLARQCRLLRERSDLVLVACAVRFVGPGGEPLFVTSRDGEALHAGLSKLELGELEGPPHHGGTMFPRAAYLGAGGYRPEFPVAQDIDLWLRLRELGRCAGEAQVGYEARMHAGSIGARRRGEQFRYAALAIECARRRSQGQDDRVLLEGAGGNSAVAPRGNERVERAHFLYFIGSCLQRSDPAAARRYYWRAFREYPLLVKSLVRLAFG